MHTLYDAMLEDVFTPLDITYNVYRDYIDGADVVDIEIDNVKTPQGQDIIEELSWEQLQALEEQCLDHCQKVSEEACSDNAYEYLTINKGV